MILMQVLPWYIHSYTLIWYVFLLKQKSFFIEIKLTNSLENNIWKAFETWNKNELPYRDAVLGIIQSLNTPQKIRKTVFSVSGQNRNDYFGFE